MSPYHAYHSSNNISQDYKHLEVILRILFLVVQCLASQYTLVWVDQHHDTNPIFSGMFVSLGEYINLSSFLMVLKLAYSLLLSMKHLMSLGMLKGVSVPQSTSTTLTKWMHLQYSYIYFISLNYVSLIQDEIYINVLMYK